MDWYVENVFMHTTSRLSITQVSLFGLGVYVKYWVTQKPAVGAKRIIMEYENVMSTVIQCILLIFKSVNIWTVIAFLGKILSFCYCAYGLKKANEPFRKEDVIFPILVVLFTIIVLAVGGFETECDCPFLSDWCLLSLTIIIIH